MSRSLYVLLFVSCLIASAQQPAAQSYPDRSSPLSFEVVSIRASKPGGYGGFQWATAADGYHVTGQSMRSTILMAYFPQGWTYWGGRLQGGPSWLDDPYDIDAKVSEADLAEWQKQGVSLDRKPMLQQMLQSMLADRCRLVFHRVPGQIDGFSLETGRKGIQFRPAPPDEVRPAGVPLPSGGILIPYRRGEPARGTFVAATMSDLAQHLSGLSVGHPVQDHTGLTGRYDFVLRWVSDSEHPEREGIVSSEDPDPLSHRDLNSLGLRLLPVKIPIANLVIDHIEKPTEN